MGFAAALVLLVNVEAPDLSNTTVQLEHKEDRVRSAHFFLTSLVQQFSRAVFQSA